MFLDQADQGTGGGLVGSHCGIDMNGRFGQCHDGSCHRARLVMKQVGDYGW